MENGILKNKFRSFCILIVIYMFFYSSMYVEHYATDTYYNILNTGVSGAMLSSGRICSFFVYHLMEIIHVNHLDFYPWLITMLIIAISFVSYNIEQLISRTINTNDEISNWIIRVGAILVFANPFFQEWFTFWEVSIQYCGALLFLALGLSCASNGNSWKQYLFQAMYLSVAIGFYQGVFAHYIIIGLTVVYLEHKGRLNQQAILKSIMVIFVAFFSGAFNICILSILQRIGIVPITSRTGNISVKIILNNARGIIECIPSLLYDGFGLYYPFLYLIILGVLLVLVWRQLICKQRNIVGMVWLVIIVMLSMLTIFIPHVLTTSFWPAQRSIVAYWVIMSMFFFVSVMILGGKIITLKGCLAIAIIALLTCNIAVNKIQCDLVSCNRMDEELAYAVNEAITRYESETGIRVLKIGVVHDSEVSWRYHSSRYWCFDTSVSARTKDWSDVNMINYYNNTKYEKVNVEESQVLALCEKNWDYYSPEEQFIFYGDTLYIIAF